MCFRCCTTAENVVQVNGYTGQITGDFVHYLLEITKLWNWFRKEVRSEVELRDVCSARSFHDFSDLTWPSCRHLPGQSWWNHNHYPIFALILQEVATVVDVFPAAGWRLQSSRRKRVKQACWKSAPLFSLERREVPKAVYVQLIKSTIRRHFRWR